MRVLVTGHTGFVGRHLFACAAEGMVGDVVCVPPKDGFSLDSIEAIEASLSGLFFDNVIHLAAQSHVPTSFAEPLATFDSNVMGTVRLLQVLHRRQFTGRLLYISSGDVYGHVDADSLPVNERQKPLPANPYAASKLAAESACMAWARFAGFATIIARPFNHLGRDQKTSFAVARFVDSIAKMATGREPLRLATGRLDVTRDFLDVRDVIDAYFALLRHGEPGEIYNICSGTERRLDEILQSLIRAAHLNVDCHVDPTLVRPVELLRMVGDASKLRAQTGWAPKIPLADTLNDLLTYQLRKYTT
ncbi:GDP-mannose 4,6-dehydratase [Hydrogenophaga laconesensis]|uniref:GDP-4-dehydro-6-deoxy-D-mannose reductase n=1 Tax=Hydrogenophaga laconesensis TaxID=1805971 RepID=A0ABU1VGY8_9BURK|nr:GDP-mannose 4,6-dehydratase [Hydrogenophaga laconesensis]MDR7096747.1 GDP-4-dehydro-6-deoxy-D-mannose reductase [Hydrogenophaga laconesensis]